MTRKALQARGRFSAYVAGLSEAIGHADRRGPLRDYCIGLVMPGERKSVEPMAAVTAPSRVAAQHQSLLHFVGQSAWSDEKVLAKVREMVLPKIEAHGPIEAWIIDDTGFPRRAVISSRACAEIERPANWLGRDQVRGAKGRAFRVERAER
jgi:SRSO17 transposase